MEPFIGQVQTFGFNFAPRGWSTCSGQLLPIAQWTALFSLLGTTYGGDGRTTFGLPDLRGRSIVGHGHGPGLSTISWGERGGRENETLTQLNMPQHSHGIVNSSAAVHVATVENDGGASNESDDGNNYLRTNGAGPEIYAEHVSTTNSIGGTSISGLASTTMPAGGQQSFNIRNPFLGMYVCIAMTGIFPSRS